MWGEDPDAFISGSYAPIGKATLVKGGYGCRGDFVSSGSPGAAWNLCGAMAGFGPKASRCQPSPWCQRLVPSAFHKNSKLHVIHRNAFVPDHRVLRFLCGRPHRARKLQTGSYGRILVEPYFALAIPSGAAAGWLDGHRREQSARGRTEHGARRQEESQLSDDPEARRRGGGAHRRLPAGTDIAVSATEGCGTMANHRWQSGSRQAEWSWSRMRPRQQ